MKLILATKNKHKVEEFCRILSPLGWQVIPQDAICPDLETEETGTTFAENAYLKAMGIYRATGLPTVADDSGLCVDALGGAPGVYSARYCGHHGDDERDGAAGQHFLYGFDKFHVLFLSSNACCGCIISPTYDIIKL